MKLSETIEQTKRLVSMREWPYRDLFWAAKSYLRARRHVVKMLESARKIAEIPDDSVTYANQQDLDEWVAELEDLLKKMPAYGSDK